MKMVTGAYRGDEFYIWDFMKCNEASCEYCEDSIPEELYERFQKAKKELFAIEYEISVFMEGGDS